MRAVRRPAHAKINLALGVGPPDPDRDSLHPIATWMHAVDLADTVDVEPARETTVRIDWALDAPRKDPIDWPVENDLGARAHALLERHVSRALPVRLAVTKRIPAGAGLGGGSSDAAATLLALNDALDLGLDLALLRALGAELGSAVPFFIDDHAPAPPALVTGFGESIERVDTRDDPLLLVLPPCACPTGRVYKAYDDLGPRPLDQDRVRALVAADPLDARDLFNDLAQPAETVRPEIRRIRDAAARAADAPMHVTGSGSAIFALGALDVDAVRASVEPLGAVVVPSRLVGPGR